MTGLYDYLAFNYINALKEKLLMATFPNKKNGEGNNVANNKYGAEDLTRADL